MAVTSSSTFASALTTVLPARLQSQINWDSLLIHLLSVLPGEGKSLNFTVEFSGQTNGSPALETATYSVSDADNEDVVPGSLPWATYNRPAAVTGLAEAQAQTSMNRQSALGSAGSLMAANAGNAYHRMLRGIAQHIYSGQSGQSPGEVVGIATSIDSTGTYGTIDPTTYTEWVSSEQTGSLSALSFNMLDTKLLTPIYDACGEAPSVLVTTSAIFDAIKSLWASNQVPWVREFEVSAPTRPGEMYRAPRHIKLDASASGIMYNGIPILRDRDCTSGTIYAANLRHLWLEQLPSRPGPVTVQDVTDALRSIIGNRVSKYGSQALEEMAGMVNNPVGVSPFFKALQPQGDQELVLCKAYLQLCNNRRNAHGKLVLS